MTRPGEDQEQDGRLVRPRRERRSTAPVDPSHYDEAVRYAREADDALQAGDSARAQALAAVGQIHATLCAGGRLGPIPGQARYSAGRRPGAGDPR